MSLTAESESAGAMKLVIKRNRFHGWSSPRLYVGVGGRARNHRILLCRYVYQIDRQVVGTLYLEAL